MEIVTARGASGDHQGRRRRKASEGHVVAQLLDSPLPTPRRSCCGSAAGTPRSARAPSPQRTHVPFSWESSPGVPRAGSANAFGGKFEGELLPPRPPPGRRRGGIGMGTPCHARAAYYGTATTDATSSDDGGGGGGSEEDTTFSDALDRISSSDRLAALSVDSGAASRRLSSFIMDRFLPAANAIATTSTEKKRAKRSPRRGRGHRGQRSEHDDDEDVAPPAHATRDVRAPCCRAPAHELHAPALQREDSSWEEDTPPRQTAGQAQNDEEARGDDDMYPPRACGFLVLFPWSVKPVLCGFPWSPARPRTSRRSSTLGDAMVKESGPRNGDLSNWYEEKSSSSSRGEWSSPGGPGLGRSILGTSRRYCADARKALSRLARSATDGGGGGPRMMSRERRSGKAVPSPLHSTSGRMPQLTLTPPSESWLRHARGSNTVRNNKR